MPLEDEGAAGRGSSSGGGGASAAAGGARTSFRGSSPPPPSESEAAGETSSRTYVDRAIRLDINNLPAGPEEYPSWRDHVITEIFGTDVDPELLQMYVQDLNTLAYADLALQGLPKELANLDGKVFKTIKKCVKGKEVKEHSDALRAEVPAGTRGGGRLAIRVLDRQMQFTAETVGVKAADSVYEAKVANMAGLGGYVSMFRLKEAELEAAEAPLHPLFALRYIRRATRGLQDLGLRTAIAGFEAKPLKEQKTKDLLTVLEVQAARWKEESNTPAGKVAAAAQKKQEQAILKQAKQQAEALVKQFGGYACAGFQKGRGKGQRGGGGGGAGVRNQRDAQGNPICNYCQKPRHIEKDCHTKQNDIKNGTLKPGFSADPSSSSSSGPSTAAAGASGPPGGPKPPDPPGTHPPCPTCKKTNHAAADCIFKDKPKGKAVAGAVVDKPEDMDLTSVLAQMLAKKAGLAGAGFIVPPHMQHQDLAAAAQYMLDCGCNIYSTNARPDVVHGPVKITEPAAVLGHQGMATVNEETDLHVPYLNKIKKATVSRKGPNMLPLGRMIYDDGLEIEKWNRRDGLILKTEEGELVPTHIQAYCPMLGPGPEFVPDATVAAAVEHAADKATDNVADVLEAMVQKLYECVDELSAFKAGSGLETTEAAEEEKEPADVENSQSGEKLVYEFTIENAKALRTPTKELIAIGCPKWSQVTHRSSINLNTMTVLEDEVAVSDMKSAELHKQLKEPVLLKTMFFYKRVEGDKTTGVPALRKADPISHVGEMPEHQLPMEHLVLHFKKNKFCFGCEEGKMKRSPAYRVPENKSSSPQKMRETHEDVEWVFDDRDEEEHHGLPRMIDDEEAEKDVSKVMDQLVDDVDIAMTALAKDLKLALSGEEAKEEASQEAAPVVVDEAVEPKEEPFVSPERKIVRRYLRKMYMDLVGPTIADDQQKTGSALLRDHDTGWPEFITMSDKTPETVLEFWTELFPGTVAQGTHPEETYCDNGGEFRGAWAAEVRRRQGRITRSLENEPVTNSAEETWHDVVTRCIRAAMKFANGPVRLWGRCGRHTTYNMQRVHDGRADGSNPYRRRYGRDSKRTLVPWACGVTFYRSAEKFEPHGMPGVILEYAQHGGFVILDLREYIQSRGNIVTTTTRHVKVRPRHFPFREVLRDYPHHDAWHLRLRDVGRGDIDWRIDYLGRVRCARKSCGKFISDEPITCRACIDKKDHGRGRTPFGCIRSRCPGHGPNQDEDEQVTLTTIETNKTVVPRSPRWRMIFKSPVGQVVTPPRSRSRSRSPPRSVPGSPRSDSRDAAPAVPDPTYQVQTAPDAVEAPDASQEDGPEEADLSPAMPPPVLGLLGAARGQGKKFWKPPLPPKEKRDPAPAYIEERTEDEIYADAAAAGQQFSSDFLEEQEKEVRSLQQELTFAFGLVTRVVDVNSREARESEGAKRAIEREVENVRSKEALVIESLMERSEAKERFPEAEYVNGRLMLAKRNAENVVASEDDWKARMLVQGCGQRDVYDKPVIDEVIQTVPAGMPEQRLGHAHQAMFDDGIGLVGDVDGFYLTTLLGGVAKFLSIFAALFPLFPDRIKTMKDPVARCRKAFYGFKRAGADAGEKAARKLKKLGFKQIKDVAMSVFVRWPILLIVYSDDMNPNGPAGPCWEAWKQLDKEFVFSKKNPSAMLTKYIGIVRVPLGVDKFGAIWYKLQQTDYLRMVVEKYKSAKGISALRPSKTPMLEKDEDLADSNEPGVDASICRMFVMSLLFVARATRQEILYATTRLGRVVGKWLKRHDRALHKLMCYIAFTLDFGLVNVVHPKELSRLFLRLWWDSDFAGSPDTERSTSGWVLWLMGAHTKVLLDACSKLQAATGVSTPEVEVVAGANALVRSGLPFWTLVEEVYGRKFDLEIGTDNSTARLDILQRYSKGMKHLKRHQRVSIALFGETVDRPGASVRKVGTDENTPDILTKSLADDKFTTHRVGLNIR